MSLIDTHRSVPTLIVPGLHGSGCDHWQSWWQAVVPDARRVEQDDWSTPDLGVWSDRLLQAVEKQSQPVWLVAHSFGCLAAVDAMARYSRSGGCNIAGAFLVAAADPDRFGLVDDCLFQALPIPTALVVSSNDPWLAEHKAFWLAQRWGSEVCPVGAAGHINTASGFGPWIEGLVLFRDFVRRSHGGTGREHAHRPSASGSPPPFLRAVA